MSASGKKISEAVRGMASQSFNATLVSRAMVAHVASGLLAGIADTLAQKQPRRGR